MSLVNTPVGYRFDPTDAELACHYLYNKVMGLPLSCSSIVQDYDLYGHEEPWKIWEKFVENNSTTTDVEAGPSSQNDLFFFTTLKKINPNRKSSRFERGVGSNGGRWHGDDVHIFHSKRITWYRKRFCYKNPNIATPDVSWIMMEYSLDDIFMQNAPHYTVLCRLRKKSNKNCSRTRQPSESSPQSMPKTVHVTVCQPHVPVYQYPINAINYYGYQDSKNYDIVDDVSLVDCDKQQYYVGEDHGDNATHSIVDFNFKDRDFECHPWLRRL